MAQVLVANTGSYNTAYVIIAGLLLVSSILAITVKAPKGNNVGFMVIDGLCASSELSVMKKLSGLTNDISEEDMKKIREDEAEKPENDRATEAYKQVFAGLEEKQYNQFSVAFKEILKKDAKVDNEKKFEEIFFNELSAEDLRLLIGKYIINFTSSSRQN